MSQANIGIIVFPNLLSKKFLLKSSKKVRQGVKLALARNLNNCGTFPTVFMVSFPVESTSANFQWKEGGGVQQMIENGHILIRFKVFWLGKSHISMFNVYVVASQSEEFGHNMIY